MNHIAVFFTLFSTLMVASVMVTAQSVEKDRYYHLLIGTYTSGKSEGIYVYKFDSETGKLSHEYTAKGVENPSFLTVSPDLKYVYAVNELGGENPGAVSSFSFNPSSGAMKFINKQPSGGDHPCYLTIDNSQQYVIVGNYSGGNLSVLPIKKDGSLSAPIQTIQHKGSSKNKDRQEKAHVHSTVFAPGEAYLFVGDLGTDKVNCYTYQPQNSASPLQSAQTPFTSVTPGSGPRHIIFDEYGNYAYLVQELTAEIGVFKHEDGKLTHVQTVPMTAEDFTGEVGAAEVRISPDGNFIYASNRGEANELTIYKIDKATGKLSFVERQSTLGKAPRNFMIDPTGKYLLVANQNSNTVVLFERDKKTGKLSQLGKQIEIGNPVYLKMVPIK